MVKTAFVLLALGCSLFATGTSSCSGVASSGCNDWWMSYSLGNVSDGSFSRSSGVSTVYTASYTTLTATQDPFAAASADSSWTVSQISNSVVSTNSYSPWTDPFATASSNSSWTPGTTYTSNVASSLPTNTGESLSAAVFSSSSSYAYVDYMNSVYAIAYGNRTSAPVVSTVSPLSINAEVLAPEPGSIVGIGLGLAFIAVQARRRMNRRKR